MEWFVLALILLVFVVIGFYYTIKCSNNGRFRIDVVEGKYHLMYCHRCEWIVDSVHKSRESARERIAQCASRLPVSIPKYPWVK